MQSNVKQIESSHFQGKINLCNQIVNVSDAMLSITETDKSKINVVCDHNWLREIPKTSAPFQEADIHQEMLGCCNFKEHFSSFSRNEALAKYFALLNSRNLSNGLN